MKTIFGTEIDPQKVKGVLYLCHYNHNTFRLTPVKELLFESQYEALNAFANIPNPASQLAMETNDKTIEEVLTALHKNMLDEQWQKELSDYF